MTKTLVILALAGLVLYAALGALKAFDAAQAQHSAQIEAIINGR